jgi:hypothetical protein
MAAKLGRLSEASTLASRSNLASRSGLAATVSGRILMATSRCSVVSRALLDDAHAAFADLFGDFVVE